MSDRPAQPNSPEEESQRIDFDTLDRLFNEALKLPHEQWPTFIAEHCGADPDAGQRLLAMLNADQAHDTRSDPLGNAISDQRSHLTPAALPEMIGPYKVEEELGRGGMGAVYRATRQHEGYEQQVAIKLLHAGTAPGVVRERFQIEQAVLARLRHSAIAGLIDAGETDDGLPYVAMEYVDGENLTDYATRRKLNERDRVKLFIQLCGAVRYAHSNLIVHRDIKPDNVLVDPQGMIKLLDFGIAKLLPTDGGQDAAGTLTRAGAMTPTYASPEQVRGQPITIASDIYSLGVLLYELLTGELPYVVDSSASTLELERQICETDPLPPSRRLVTGEQPASGASAVNPRRLRGDLDRILLKAMRKEPERRYDSAAQFADDLQRFLEGRTVSARPDSLGYRLQKLVSRNPLGAAATALLFVSLLAFTFTTRWQSLQIEAERDTARQEAEAARQVADFMVGLFERSDPRTSDMKEVTARDLLDEAAATIDQEMAAAPINRARLMHIIGMAYVNQGDYSGGLVLMEKALNVRREVFGNDSLEVADSLNRMGNFHREFGQPEKAETALREALEIRERLASGPDTDLADSYNNFGLFLRGSGKYEQAIEMLNRSRQMHEAVTGPDSLNLGAPLHNLAQAHHALGEYRRAKQLLERSLEIKRNQGMENRATYANSLAALAAVETDLGLFETAIEHRALALEIRRAAFADAHPSLVAGLTGMAA
ncbi:MAG: serine/threonine-protein kinase, partial [Pseudomonadota bacterium]